jgi:predicted Zn-dependent protease
METAHGSETAKRFRRSGGEPVETSRNLHAARRGWAILWIALLAASVTSARPAQAGGLFNFNPSVEDQIKLGDQEAAQVMKQYHVVHDYRERELQDVGNRLLDALPSAQRGPWSFRFHVIENKELNAFALPGGNVFMFTGLMDKIHTEDELAAVLGHEMTHVREQHWAKMYSASQKRSLTLGVLLGLSHASRGVQDIASLGNNLLDLRYSRKDEDQADAEGLQDMVDAGYNPKGMLDLFHTLQSAGGGGGAAFLSDHPLTKDRIKHTQERIDALGERQFKPEVPLEHH